MVVDADDVACNGVRHHDAVLSHEGQGVRDLHVAVLAHVEDLHALRIAARADAEERNAVAVTRVHVGLDLEDEARERRLGRFDLANAGITRLRRRSPLHESVKNVLHAEVVHTGTEEDGALLARKELLDVERFGRTLNEFDGLAHVRHFHREETVKLGIVEPFDHLLITRETLLAGRKAHKTVLQQREDAAEGLAHADGPGDGHALELEHVLDFADHVERIAHFAVELVDERDDRRLAHAADFEKLDCLGFHALGGIDHHHGGVDGGQHSVRVFREVLMARGVEQVDDVIVIVELHHRTRHGNAALLFDFHPVGRGVTGGLTALDGAGHLNGAAEQKELFRERRLAGVRMGNDGKGAAHFDVADQCGVGTRHNRERSLNVNSMKIGSSAELSDGKADHFNRERRGLQPNSGRNLYLRSLANAAAMAPCDGAAERVSRRAAGACLRAPSLRMLRLMRWRARSTSRTLTLTMSPTFTTSRGSDTRRSAR